MAMRYTIPLFIPSAVLLFPSLSRTALHMAHCASTDDENKRRHTTTKINPVRLQTLHDILLICIFTVSIALKTKLTKIDFFCHYA